MAQKNLRKYSNDFLSIGVGARAAAMGNTQTATVNNVNAGYWNPAGLTQLKHFQLGLMHNEWFASVAKYDYVAFATPITNNKRAIGFSAIRLGVDDIPNTLNLVAPDGSINYNNITTFSAADYAFLVSYAQTLKKISIGTNAKVTHRAVCKFAKAWGVGLAVALLYKTKKLNVGVTVKDLTFTPVRWSTSFTEEEQTQLQLSGNLIPLNTTELAGQKLSAGIGYRFPMGKKAGLTLAADFDFTFDGKRNTLVSSDILSIDPHAGLEFDLNNIVFLRAGINNIQKVMDDAGNPQSTTAVQPNFGAGFRVKEIQIDYALAANRMAEGIYSHIISLQLDIVKRKNKPAAPKAVPLLQQPNPEQPLTPTDTTPENDDNK